MASFNSSRHGVGVYLVCPLSSAALAASLINAGVSKSGSPAPNPTTSIPALRIAAALALTASVIDSEISFISSASGNIVTPIWAGNGIPGMAPFQASRIIEKSSDGRFVLAADYLPLSRYSGRGPGGGVSHSERQSGDS